MDGFFADLERQMADIPPRDVWHQAEVTCESAYWCAVREADAWARVEKSWQELGSLIDAMGRELGLTPSAE